MMELYSNKEFLKACALLACLVVWIVEKDQIPGQGQVGETFKNSNIYMKIEPKNILHKTSKIRKRNL